MRLGRKLKQLEGKLSKVEKFSNQTGYKNVLHDCFALFSYVGGLVLIIIGLKPALVFIFPSVAESRVFALFTGGVLIGAGVVLLEQFYFLVQVEKSKESIVQIKSKIENLKEKI